MSITFLNLAYLNHACLNLACFFAQTPGAKSITLMSSALPESKMLMLLGGGLIALAGVVRQLGPSASVRVPKTVHVIFSVPPKEIAEHFSIVDRRS